MGCRMQQDNSGIKANTRTALYYFAVLAGAIVFYVISCAPGALWQDSGMIQYRVLHNDIKGGMGLALSHPLFYMLAIGTKFIPFGGFIYKVNLVAVIAAAVAVANVFLFLRLWLGKTLPAVVGSVSLAVSHTFWWHAEAVETYTLYTAVLTAELIMLLQYVRTRQTGYLYWLGLLNGLSIADHMLGSIPFLCYAVFIVVLLAKKHIRAGNFAIIVLLWIAGAMPYEYLIVRELIQTGEFVATLKSAAFGSSWQGAVLNTSLSLKITKENIIWILLNFPTPNILLLFVGLAVLYRVGPSKWFSSIIMALLVLFLVFAFRYTIVDRYAFFIPFYCMVSILMGVGASVFFGREKRKVLAWLILLLILLPIPVYAAAPKLAQQIGVKSGRGREIPYRNDYTYFLLPWKTGYTEADRFANDALTEASDKAIIYADGSIAYSLLLAQEIGGKRPDVTIVSEHGTINNLNEYNDSMICKLYSQRGIYVVSAAAGYCPQFLLERYNFEKAGVLYKAVEKKK